MWSLEHSLFLRTFYHYIWKCSQSIIQSALSSQQMIFLFHPQQNQDERVLPYILLFPYVFRKTLLNSIFVSTSTTPSAQRVHLLSDGEPCEVYAQLLLNSSSLNQIGFFKKTFFHWLQWALHAREVKQSHILYYSWYGLSIFPLSSMQQHQGPCFSLSCSKFESYSAFCNHEMSHGHLKFNKSPEAASLVYFQLRWPTGGKLFYFFWDMGIGFFSFIIYKQSF